ncbi:glycoside hydrolase family 3 protein [Vibrio alginolyticus]|uniref:glycoside hydrolase family 3 protein n=1 Tax=Vibrio alginolyticus TaxID=663 RepID=UPI001BD1BFA6|nr:glycoside hydrolase family 3 protein [Vibrio alginolyticus]MBS9848123.1 glycoside hydrolase family 3 C-terminal domain-containing protein [Vibrio alginolyticus]WED60828.1 glycoside hydrolase family 3 N-terminal domain-containing protein [Vibrio alginolyticus]
MLNTKKNFISIFISLALVGCFNENKEESEVDTTTPYFAEWENVNSIIKKDPAIESEIQRILNQMTLEEKVGQMIQPDLRDVTPEEAKKYKLGSILNGGGAAPNGDKYATAEDWAKEADKFWIALEEAYADRGFRVPFMWATDAVHGHNNVFQATIFPHNIGLGAARNPDLIEEIGKATAREVAATGLDWTFAPTVATPRDERWGRVYEGYSEDPEIVYEYAQRMVQGLQGGEEGLKGDTNVVSNVKHWVGDGGTFGGVDHGENRYTEEYLRNIHSMGYIGGLKAGAQVVMSSFNSWWNESNYDPMVDKRYLDPDSDSDYMQNQKVHGSAYLISDVLKGKMGFDGVVVTDWNGQGEINGCTAANCAQAVIAGNDVFMVTSRNDWQAFYQNVIDQVNSGLIPMERIDDAVTRILRVKMRANMWEKPMPSERSLAGNQDILSAPEHVAIARKAVSESLVLLKNDSHALPLKKEGQKYLVVGSAANDITKQTGGWSLSWQGDGNTVDKDFPNAQTMLMAMQEVVGEENIITDTASTTPEEAIAVVVIGEDPYAEMFGDISKSQTLEFASIKPSYKKDSELIKSLKEQGFKVVTVFYSGRQLYVNDEINNSDAFVAAWLPGTEGLGITDVLFGDKDFKGKLSYTWGKTKCSTTINRVAPNIPNYITPVDGSHKDTNGNVIEQELDGEYGQLFPYGYGLNYSGETDVAATEEDLNKLPLDPRDYGCGMDAHDTGVASEPLEVFGKSAKGEFTARISGDVNGWSGVAVSKGETSIGSLTTKGIDYQGMQQSALNIKFAGSVGEFENKSAAQVYMQTPDEKGQDYNRYMNANSTIEFDVRMKSPAPTELILSTHCEYPCRGEVNVASILPTPSEEWTTIKVPTQCLADTGMSFQMMNTAFLLYSAETTEFDLGNVRYVPQPDEIPSDAVKCEDLLGEVLPPLTNDSYNVLVDWAAEVNTTNQYSTDNWQPLPEGVTHMTASNEDGTVVVHYNSDSPESYKGILHFNFEPKNLENFKNGSLKFTVNVKTLGAQKPDSEQTGLVIKVGGEKGDTGDIFVEQLSGVQLEQILGQDQTVIVQMSDILSKVDNAYFAQSLKSFTIFPAWANTQAGVKFEVKDIKFVK